MRSSDLHDLTFFGDQRIIDDLDIAVCQGLDFLRPHLVLVFTHVVVFLGLLDGLHTVAAHIANGHTGLFCIAMGDFDKFDAALFVELRQRDANQLTVRYWIKAKIGVSNGFLDSNR